MQKGDDHVQQLTLTRRTASESPDVGSLRGLLAKGFRPFFALAALHALVAVPVWVVMVTQNFAAPSTLPGFGWHAHEMIFGFTIAVVAGFLLTAVGNWTKRETATGFGLTLLTLLWLAGRVAPFVLPRVPAALLDVAFLPALMVTLARPLVGTGNRRNYAFLALLGGLFLCNVTVHLGVAGVLPGWERTGHYVAVDFILVVIAIMTARIVPMFTRNATGARVVRHPWSEGAAIAGLLSLVVCRLLDAAPEVVTLVAAGTACALLLRSRHWGSAHVFVDPLLWVLHVGVGWVALSVALRAASPWWVSEQVWLHAATAGAIATLCLGMMARVALGHTGRMLAAPRWVSRGFVLLTLAAVIRVGVPLVVPEWYRFALYASGALWSVAFATYAVVYLPMLVRPRVDGKPG